MHTMSKYLNSQLQALGVHDWQCVVAIMQFCIDLEACIAFLLKDANTSEEESKAYILHLIARVKSESSPRQLDAGAQAHKGQIPD